MCLVFRSMPRQTLVSWLPEGVKMDGEFGALNIASPLDNGAREREWADLSEWDDPLVQDYLNGDRKRGSGAYSNPKDGEQAERKASRDTTHDRNKQPWGDQHVIQVSAPALLLVGAAVLAGYLLLKNGTGPGRR